MVADIDISDTPSTVGVSFPALQTAGGNLYIYNCVGMATIALPNLSHIEHDLYVGYESPPQGSTIEMGTTSLDMASLVTIGGDLEIYRVGPLTTVEFPSLVSVWDVDISNSPSVVVVSFPALVTTGEDFHVYDCANMTTISAPKLETIGDDMWLGNDDFVAANDMSVTSVDLSSLKTLRGHLRVYGMGPLTSISFPSLTQMGGVLKVKYNANLESISFPVLALIDGGSNPDDGTSPGINITGA